MYAFQERLHKVRRNWVGAFVAVIVVLIISSCAQLYFSYQQHLDAIDKNLENLSMTLIKQAEAEFRSTEVALRYARDRLQEKNTLGKLNPQQAFETFREIISTFNQSSRSAAPNHLFWADANGVVRATSYSNPTPEIIAADRSYFEHHQKDASPDVYFSGSMQSRLTNRWVIYQTTRLNDTQGNFAGVVGITTRIDAFETFFKQLNLQEDSSIVLAEAEGRWSYRHPFVEEYADIDFSETDFFEWLRERRQGSVTVETSPYDNRPRRIGYYWGDTMGLVAAVSLSQQAVWREFYPVLQQRVTLLAFTLLVLGVAAYAYSSIYRRTDEAMRLANVDELTQIPNRRYLDEHLQQLWRSLKRTERPLGLLFIDVDYFKPYNDKYGHDAGDRCLRKVVNSIKQVLKRPDDFLARYGGEEFIVLLPGNDYAQTEEVAQRILQTVRTQQIPHVESPIEGILTVSIGFASVVPQGDDLGRHLKLLADKALYMAKHAGRDQICGLKNDATV